MHDEELPVERAHTGGDCSASDQGRYVLRLYVTGTSSTSARAVVNIRALCEAHLRGRYDLQVINIAEQPAVASRDQIIAAPTLIRELPLPLRRFIGDMSEADRVLVDIDRHALHEVARTSNEET